MTETIVSNVHSDAWICICGNDTMFAGFVSADHTGREVEPTAAAWDGTTMRCNDCGRLLDASTHRPNPEMTSEFDSHLIDVIGMTGSPA
jgi:hypothetical protein